MEYEYVINLLQKEKAIFEKLLNDWDINNQPEAKKERDEKLYQINRVLSILKTIQTGLWNAKLL